MSNAISLTWPQFLSQAKQFVAKAQQLNDNWILYEKDEQEANTFLKYAQKVKFEEDVINVEYHIVYSISYQVPMLYFIAHRSDGSLLNLEAIWQLFMPDTARSNLYQILTQMEHPVLFRPYMALHPCRTAEMLSQLGQQSENSVLTFISLYGPFVKLNLGNAYGLNVAKNANLEQVSL